MAGRETPGPSRATSPPARRDPSWGTPNAGSTDIDRTATGSKCFTLTVTDPALIEKTGGIVQGMSGSPVIQNGKLVGAVTHVLINDPTAGYGIFIENMLREMPGMLG